jgi:hypothetical protein
MGYTIEASCQAAKRSLPWTCGKRAAQELGESVVAKIGIIPKAAPEHPVVPVLVHLQLPGRVGFRAQKLATPDVAIRTVVVAPGYLVRDIPDELPHEVGRPPAEVEVVVVAEGPDGLEVADVFDKALAKANRADYHTILFRI